MIADADFSTFAVSTCEQPGIEIRNIEYVSYALMDAKMHFKKGLSHENVCICYRIKRTIMSCFAVENTCKLLTASGKLV